MRKPCICCGNFENALMSFRGSGAGGGFEFRIWFINGVKIEDSAQRQMSVNARMIKNTYCNHFIKYLCLHFYIPESQSPELFFCWE